MNFNHDVHTSHKTRPLSSISMTDLSIYVVPLDLWDEQQNLALNEIINETISAGFIRVEPELPLYEIRTEIHDQLGYEFVPKEYMFCKSVGRCLALVREKQENILKAKHFLPPNSYAPELFVVDSIVAKRSQLTSDSTKTYNSSLGPELRIGRRTTEENIQRERIEHEREIERRRLEEENEARLREREFQRQKEDNERDNNSFQKMQEKEEEFNTKKMVVKPSDDPVMEARRHEIEELQNEIMKKYQELESLERTHQRKIAEWEQEDERRKQEEEERRKLFEEMELERQRQEQAIIDKQKEELKRLEEMLKDKHVEIISIEEQLEMERNEREKLRFEKETEMENLKDKVQENIKPDSEMNEQIEKLQNELEEMDKKQKELENLAKLEREQAEVDFENARVEFAKLKVRLEEEKAAREKENSERLREEQRLREMYEQSQREHAKRMEEERMKMIEERERFDEEQRCWNEERIRYEEEERRRLEEMEMAIKEALTNKPVIPPFELKDPELILEGASESEQRDHLKKVLKALKVEKDTEEKVRDNAIKTVRTMQFKIQNRRNNLKDIWKKKYLEEKKKSPPLEEQLNKYKDELDSLHRRLVNSMEVGMKDNKGLSKHPGRLSPSNKANLILEAFRIQHDIEDIRQKIEFNQMRLSAEMKLRAQTENELKVLKMEAMHKKIRLSRTRSDHLAIVPHTNSLDFIYSPHVHPVQSSGSISNIESVNY